MSYERPHEDRLGDGTPVVDDVLSWTGTGTAEWKTPAGGSGGVTVKHLDASDPEAATILRVAHFTVNAANDVTLFPQVTGEGAGALAFEATQTFVMSPDGTSAIFVRNSGVVYTYAEHSPGDLANVGVQVQVGTDFVGLFISEKDSGTIQVYDDSGGAYDIELVDQGAFGFLTSDGTNISALSLLHGIKAGSADPSSGAGVASGIGSVYERSSGGVGSLWLKTGAADTAWTQLAALAGSAQTYTESNVTTDRSYNANSTTIDELADVLGTLIGDLRNRGIVA